MLKWIVGNIHGKEGVRMILTASREIYLEKCVANVILAKATEFVNCCEFINCERRLNHRFLFK